jgi:hypothetical protein
MDLKRLSRLRIVGMTMTVAFCMFVVASQAASAALTTGLPGIPADPALTAAFAKGDGLSTAQAEHRVAVQQAGSILGRELEEKLGSNYAGIWYDDSTERIAIGIAHPTDTAAVDSVVNTAEAQSNVEEVPVRSTMAELINAQSTVNGVLGDLIHKGEASTGIYTPGNAVVVEVSSKASTGDQERANAISTLLPDVKVQVRSSPQQDFEIKADACSSKSGRDAHCDRPMRGGTEITGSAERWVCSAGLLAKAGETYYMMTAGHCIVDEGGSNVPWIMFNSSNTAEGIGNSGGFVYGEKYKNPGGTGDSGAIAINPTSYWHTGLNAYAYAYTYAEEYPTLGVAEPYVGLGVCHLGISTPNNGSGTNCGEVLLMHATVTYSEGNTLNNMAKSSACSHPGDSGGPFYASNYAYGTTSGGSSCAEEGGFNSGTTYFETAGNIQYEEGVTLCRLSAC